jgi:uncharacterized C2H2 Zn-finger protein
VPVQASHSGPLSVVPNSELDFQQPLLSPVQDWSAGFDFASLLNPRGLASDLAQSACVEEVQHDSPWSGQSSLTSCHQPTPPSMHAGTSSPTASWCASSPVAADKANSGAGVSYPCPECGKIWDSRDKLSRHVRYHEKPFGCPNAGCGERFSTRSDLKRHEGKRAHGGQKQFRCLRCPKAYNRMDNLQRHHRKAHKVSLPRGRGRILGSSNMGGK